MFSATTTDGPLLVERDARRIASGGRHPGHVDHVKLEENHALLLSGRAVPIDQDLHGYRGWFTSRSGEPT